MSRRRPGDACCRGAVYSARARCSIWQGRLQSSNCCVVVVIKPTRLCDGLGGPSCKLPDKVRGFAPPDRFFHASDFRPEPYLSRRVGRSEGRPYYLLGLDVLRLYWKRTYAMHRYMCSHDLGPERFTREQICELTEKAQHVPGFRNHKGRGTSADPPATSSRGRFSVGMIPP